MGGKEVPWEGTGMGAEQEPRASPPPGPGPVYRRLDTRLPLPPCVPGRLQRTRV